MKLTTTANRNASLEKASRVLAAFSEETPELGVMDLARRVGLNKSTASRFVSTLTQLGLLERTEEGRKVRLSLRLFELGMRAARSRPLVVEAQPVLQRLCEQSRETTWLATPAGEDIVFVSRLAGSREAPVIDVGRRYESDQSELARLLRSGPSMAEIAEGADPVVGSIPEVLVDRGQLIEAVNLVAGPVFDRTGCLVGALGLASISDKNGSSTTHFQLVRRAGAELSRRLGFLRTATVSAVSSPAQRSASGLS